MRSKAEPSRRRGEGGAADLTAAAGSLVGSGGRGVAPAGADGGAGPLRVRVKAVRPMGRACGGCTACCTAMAVDELYKPGFAPCRHMRAAGDGCSCYGSRPASCRAFECLWLRGLVLTADEHRPDRIGLVLTPTEDERTIVAREVRPGASAEPAARILLAQLRRARLRVLVLGPDHHQMLQPITVHGVAAAAADR